MSDNHNSQVSIQSIQEEIFNYFEKYYIGNLSQEVNETNNERIDETVIVNVPKFGQVIYSIVNNEIVGIETDYFKIMNDVRSIIHLKKKNVLIETFEEFNEYHVFINGHYYTTTELIFGYQKNDKKKSKNNLYLKIESKDYKNHQSYLKIKNHCNTITDIPNTVGSVIVIANILKISPTKNLKELIEKVNIYIKLILK
jgi:hypothetical protein